MRAYGQLSRWEGLKRVFGFRGHHNQRARERRIRRILSLEPLEQRTLLSVCLWDGEGADANWMTPENWIRDGIDDVAPIAGDDLIFAGTERTSTTNDFPADTEFHSIVFGGSNFTLGGTNRIVLTGGITVCEGVANSSASLPIELSGSVTVNVADTEADTDLALSGVMSGTGSLTKTGAGTLTLADSLVQNTYGGGTYLNSGGLSLLNDAALGASTGTLHLAGGTLYSSGAEPHSRTLANPVEAQARTTSTLNVPAAGYYLRLDGALTGSGTIEVPSGFVRLEGNNTAFDGTFKVLGGATYLLSANAGSGLASWVVDSNLIGCAPSGSTIALGSLSGSGTLKNMGAGSLTYLVGGRNEWCSFSGTIQDGTSGKIVGLTKTGTNMLVLAGENAYTSATILNQGELRVTGYIPSSNVTVNGGTLSGNGTIGGSVTVNGGSVLPGVAYAGTLETGALHLGSGSTYTMQITDSNTNLVSVTGDVQLDGGVLDLTADRSDSYGILRVLIQNDGNDPVAGTTGTFAGLAENAELEVDGLTYFITYCYNAEMGTFGDGNDVAIVSALFTAFPNPTDGVVIEEPVCNSNHVLDATYLEYTLEKYASQFQLSIDISNYDPNWPSGTPTFTYTMLDGEEVATVNHETGLVTFSDEGQCRVLVESDDPVPKTLAVCLSGTTWGGEEDSEWIPDAFDPSEHVLVLYNANYQDIEDLKDYYLESRFPGANVHVLGLDHVVVDGVTHSIPNTVTTSGNYGHYSSVPSQDYLDSIAQQVVDWMTDFTDSEPNSWLADPSGPAIRYIVGLCGLPSGTGNYDLSGDTSTLRAINMAIADYISDYNEAHLEDPYPVSPSDYTGDDRFTIGEYGAPLVTWLDCTTYDATLECGSYDGTYAFIDKVTAAAAGLQADGVTISGTAAGINGDNWILDDAVEDAGYDFFLPFYSALVSQGVDQEHIEYEPSGVNDFPLSTPLSPGGLIANPIGYGSHGTHCWELARGVYVDWANGGTGAEPERTYVEFTADPVTGNHCGWWVGMSVESYNGMYGNNMADPMSVFDDNAFGGTDYSNTPVCWVGHTGEPGVSGVNNHDYFALWARGYSSLEAAWASRRTERFLAVTDVCLHNVTPQETLTGDDTVYEGTQYTLTLGEVDDPANKAARLYIVHWGDGEQEIYTAKQIKDLNGELTHTYDAGPAVATISVDLVYENASYSTVAAKDVTINAGVVVDRHVFYNQSYLDGNNAGANAADDNAIDASVVPWVVSEEYDPDNNRYTTGYNKGINGVMVDIENLADPQGLSAEDFSFQYMVSGEWTVWTGTPTVAVRTGAGTGGSDRVTLIFPYPGNVFYNNWMKVTVSATDDTGLQEPDVFCFGNLPGDANGDRFVGADDLDILCAHWGEHGPWQNGLYVSNGDINVDNFVGLDDLTVMRAFWGHSLADPPGEGNRMMGGGELYSSSWSKEVDEVYFRYGFGDDDPTNDLALGDKLWDQFVDELFTTIKAELEKEFAETAGLAG